MHIYLSIQMCQWWSQCDGDRQLHLFCVPEGPRQRRLHQDPQRSERSGGQDVCHLGERSGTSSLCYRTYSDTVQHWDSSVWAASNSSYAASCHCCPCDYTVCGDEAVGWIKRCIKQGEQQHGLKWNCAFSIKCRCLQVSRASLVLLIVMRSQIWLIVYGGQIIGGMCII